MGRADKYTSEKVEGYLHCRFKKDLAGKRRGILASLLGKHVVEEHSGADVDVKCRMC